ncbi:MAG: patatin family protein [Clostridia bacterium]|nr:patatin family protein [Clostridia bacterium]
MKKGLVLEGGAMRGLFTAGVVDALLEEDIKFDGAVGVSAGAAFGCNFKSKQKGRVLRYNTRYCKDKRYCSLFSLLTTGSLYGADFCYRLLPEKLDVFDWKTYEENPMPFWAVCTDVKTGKAAYFLCEGEKERQMDVFRASASMPLVSPKVPLDEGEYLDGGISDSIPLSFMEEKGFEKNLVVLTQPRNYQKEKASALPVLALRYGKKSGIYRAMEKRHEMYNKEKEFVFQREKEGKAFVLLPKEPLPVQRVEKDEKKLFLAHKIGYDTAKSQMASLKAFLEEK